MESRHRRRKKHADSPSDASSSKRARLNYADEACVAQASNDENEQSDKSDEPCTSRASVSKRRRRSSKLLESNVKDQMEEFDITDGIFHTLTNPSEDLSLTMNSSFKTERCGKIHSMRLQNFMCHENLFIEFGPNINFLVGCNGSGKSAVLTALVLGLANSARSTNRGSTTKSFIKTGENSATIEIVLTNNGNRPFLPDTYGNFITIIRQIRQTSSQYYAKDARGNVISKSLSHIRRILLFFGIRPENPVFVLNQDTARVFLKKLEPSSNFVLFHKATQLEICRHSLSFCYKFETLFDYEIWLRVQKAFAVEEQVQQYEDKLLQIENKNSAQDEIQVCKVKLAWISVKECEVDYQEVQRKVEEIKNREDELISLKEEYESKKEDLKAKLNEQAAIRDGTRDRIKTQDVNVNEAMQVVRRCKESTHSIKSNIKNLSRRLAEEEHNLEDAKNYLKNYHKEFSQINRLKEAHKNELEEMVSKMSDNRIDMDSNRTMKIKVEKTIHSLEESIDVTRKEMSSILKKKGSLKAEIDSLMRNKTDKMSVFGNKALQVMHLLRQEYADFKDLLKMPRGPLGRYITVPNPRYRDLIEYQLQHILTSYIVSSAQQKKMLRELLEKVYGGTHVPPIILSNFAARPYNIAACRVRAPSHTSVLIDEIRCEDPIVLNYIIDTVRAESIIISESTEIAKSLTSHTENVPPNLTRVLVPIANFEYLPAPNYGCYSLSVRKATYIQVEVGERISQIQSEIKEKDTRVEKLKADNANYNRELDNYHRELKICTSAINGVMQLGKTFLKRKVELENYQYKELPAQHLLETHVEDSSKKIDEYKRDLESLNTKVSESNEIEEKAQEKVQQEMDLAKYIEKEKDAAQTEYEHIKSQIQDLDARFKGNSSDLQVVAEQHKSLEKNKVTMTKALNRLKDAANEIGPHIEVTETAEQVKENLSRLDAKVKQFESIDMGSSKEIKENIELMKSEMVKLKGEVKLIDDVAKELRTAFRQRSQCYINLRETYFRTFELGFKNALSLRKFCANVVMDTEARTINIDVTHDDKSCISKTNTLSGGEQSFTTVSLLKGLWATSDHPFYFLDEYDVFTDEINRKCITDILISEGMHYKNRQYCFLTPLDTQVDPSPYITVHKLDPPERRK